MPTLFKRSDSNSKIHSQEHNSEMGFILSPTFYRIHKLSDMVQRLLLVKVAALVSPSPVRLAMVKVGNPSPPNPSAA